MKKWLKILLILLPITFLSSMCESNNGLEIPYVLVEENLLLYGDLLGLGEYQSLEIDGGVNGLIIYQAELYNFHAYDRTCTLWPDHNTAVVADTSIIGAYICPKCKSKYLLLLNADPVDGPAVFGLKEYYTVLNGDILHVYN